MRPDRAMGQHLICVHLHVLLELIVILFISYLYLFFVHLDVLLELIVRDEEPEAAEPVPEQREHHEALSYP